MENRLLTPERADILGRVHHEKAADVEALAASLERELFRLAPDLQ